MPIHITIVKSDSNTDKLVVRGGCFFGDKQAKSIELNAFVKDKSF
jgi:hypothetical protein